GKPAIGGARGFGTQSGAEGQSNLLEGVRVLRVCNQTRAQAIGVMVLKELAARAIWSQSRKQPGAEVDVSPGPLRRGGVSAFRILNTTIAGVVSAHASFFHDQ